MDFVLNATYIVIGQGGNLIIGWEDQPMKGSVLISLNGNWDTQDIPIQDGPNVGSKAIGKYWCCSVKRSDVFCLKLTDLKFNFLSQAFSGTWRFTA